MANRNTSITNTIIRHRLSITIAHTSCWTSRYKHQTLKKKTKVLSQRPMYVKCLMSTSLNRNFKNQIVINHQTILDCHIPMERHIWLVIPV